jgi:pimeloyl-ACP methyl ester carboxylesterase
MQMNRLIAAAAAIVLVIPGSVPAAQPAAASSPSPNLIQPDPPRDATHPARNRQLVIPSGPVVPALGRPAEMNALFFLAAGEGPKPTMLLLHGLPGNERNLDLAQAVRRAGWNVLTFTYRGAWGSEGTFSIQHAMADAQAALAFLRKPETASEFGVDTSRIVVAGHSMGGMAAAVAASDDPAPAGLILIDAWDIAVTAREAKAAGQAGRAAFIAGFDDIGHSLGPITATDLADNVISRGEEWNLRALAPKLARLPVLSVYATHGIAADNKALAAALRAQPRARVQAVEMDSDHAFADHRVALAAEVVRWLHPLSK